MNDQKPLAGLNVSRTRSRPTGPDNLAYRWGHHLRLGALAGVRTGPAVVGWAGLTCSTDVHKLVCPHRVDEVAQVFVVKVAGEEAWQVDLKAHRQNVKLSAGSRNKGADWGRGG